MDKIIATYKYPEQLLPDYHHALYQMLTGVEQGHSDASLRLYAKNLREYADKTFVEIS